MTYRPVVLAVLDGWGEREATHGNAIAAAQLPNWHGLLERYPHTLLRASGEAVGLPKGIMGNSEVGHMNLGSGRVVPQGVTLIDAEIASGDFAKNATLAYIIDRALQSGGTLHLMGLLSDGQVHSSMVHLFALIDAAVAAGVSLAIDAFLDGRDTPPKSAAVYIEALERKLSQLGRSGAISSIAGRFYAMDRDNRAERTQLEFALLAHGDAEHRAPDALTALHEAYARGETDEFVKPTIVGTPRPVGTNDACIFFNFRPDRARQLTAAFNDGPLANVPFATMTKYDETYPNPVLFGPRPQHDTLGEVFARAGLHQLRLAETEKYAHVTYFFNGGREERFTGEDRQLIDSDRSVPTYDLAPAMRAREITAAAVAAIESGRYDAIIMNYANADMVGHTGKWEPTIEAVEVIDACLAPLVAATLEAGGLLAITADHGNAEEEIDATGNPVTAHTTNLVPFVLVASGLHGTLASGGKLGDVAPTLLSIMHLPIPQTMTGANLFEATAS